jgi:hypothetical protein
VGLQAGKDGLDVVNGEHDAPLPSVFTGAFGSAVVAGGA